jgi:hypothetical protein
MLSLSKHRSRVSNYLLLREQCSDKLSMTAFSPYVLLCIAVNSYSK